MRTLTHKHLMMMIESGTVKMILLDCLLKKESCHCLSENQAIVTLHELEFPKTFVKKTGFIYFK